MTPHSRISAAPIRVVVGAGGKQLFEQFADPRVELVPTSQAPGDDVDLIVIPCGTSLVLELPDAGLPPSLWQAVAAGRTGVIFDASAEGRVHTPRTEALHAFLRARGVAPSRAVYLTQERNYRDEYVAHCAAAGVGPPMSVLLHDYWIWRFLAQFAATGKRVFKERLADFRARQPARPRRYVSFNLTPRPTKVLFLLSLLRDGLWDQGFISFGGFDQVERSGGRGLSVFAREMRRLPGFEDLAAELEPLLPALDARGHRLLGKAPRHKAPLLDRKLTEFDRSWFSVVTETEMRSRVSRITEKPLKALVNFHPLVVFGNPGSLHLIRDLGFRTFGEVIDEAYDDEPDPRRRFELVYAEVQRLCRLDEAELQRMEASLADTFEHNAMMGLIQLPRIRRVQHAAALIDQILALTLKD